MKTTLNLTTAGAALVLFASTLVMPMQANAADRQISVKPRLDKIKSFTVKSDDKAAAAIEVASTSRDKAQPTFDVDDQPAVNVNDGTQEQANNDRATPPKPPKVLNTKKFTVPAERDEAVVPSTGTTQEFRVPNDNADADPAEQPNQQDRPVRFKFEVKNESTQAAQEPKFDDEDTEEPINLPPPAKKLTQKVKPAPVETEEGSDVTDQVSEEAKNEAISADQPEATAEAATDDDAALQQEYAELLRQKHEILLKRAHQQYQDDGSYQDSYQPTYQQSYQTNYEGASCEQNNNGY